VGPKPFQENIGKRGGTKGREPPPSEEENRYDSGTPATGNTCGLTAKKISENLKKKKEEKKGSPPLSFAWGNLTKKLEGHSGPELRREKPCERKTGKNQENTKVGKSEKNLWEKKMKGGGADH